MTATPDTAHPVPSIPPGRVPVEVFISTGWVHGRTWAAPDAEHATAAELLSTACGRAVVTLATPEPGPTLTVYLNDAFHATDRPGRYIARRRAGTVDSPAAEARYAVIFDEPALARFLREHKPLFPAAGREADVPAAA